MSKISLTRSGPVALLAIDDGKANTVDIATFTDMLARLDEAAHSDAGSLLITGRAGYFCAGLDLKKMPTLGADGLAETVRLFGETMLRVFTFPRPVVAAVDGHAYGAGAILALACDVRLAADGPLKLAMNEVPIGMTVPTFGVEIARASVSPSMHADLVLHGRAFTAAELRERAVVESLHAPPELHAAALTRAEGLAGLNGAAYDATKTRLRSAAAELARRVLVAESRELTRGFVTA